MPPCAAVRMNEKSSPATPSRPTPSPEKVAQRVFQGFVKVKPVRALAALWCLARRGEFPIWAWQRFLNRSELQGDSPRFTQLIAGRVVTLPREVQASIMQDICNWLDL